MESTIPGFHTIDARVGPCNLTFAEWVKNQHQPRKDQTREMRQVMAILPSWAH